MTLKKIFKPECFQGRLNKRQYFEGWYFKQVTSDGKHTVALIPGISLDAEDSHSFVQVILAPEMKTYYFKYPLGAFRTTDAPFSVTVGGSVFSKEGCYISLDDDTQDPPQGITITGEIYYTEWTKIQTRPWMPNIMGFFAYIPGMECNHGVLSMNHFLKGYLSLGSEKSMDFNGGKGYIEKDWGKSFPSEYIWIQANQFENKGQSFMCSIATIPFGWFSFRGLIANLIVDGKEYRFATYNRTKVHNFVVSDTGVSFDLIQGSLILSCEATIAVSGKLKAPIMGQMNRTIKEGLSGEVKLTLKGHNECPLTLKSQCAGIEIVMNHGA